jgi:cysteine-rich repeat protein
LCPSWEGCDDGPQNSATRADACRSTCVPARCGDGVVDDGERCDTGAQNSDVQPGACRTSCLAATCGDGVRDPGEGCDDGDANNDLDADACRTSCERARCGDGVIDAAERCDDGNTRAGDGCRGDCLKLEVCGDGIVDDNESCDDANTNPRDGCAGCRGQSWSSALVVAGEIEGRLALQAALHTPEGVAVDAVGRIFVVDSGLAQVRRIDPDGSITVVAGTGRRGFSGDGGPAAAADL